MKLDNNPKCPTCGKLGTLGGLVDRVDSHADIAKPKKGYLSICVYCSSINQFDENEKLHLANKDDFDAGTWDNYERYARFIKDTRTLVAPIITSER